MSANEKLFSVAGTARNPDGTVKSRFANDLVSRIKILNKAGCTDINLVELPEPMTKLGALQYLQASNLINGDDASFAVSNKVAEKSKQAKKGEVRVKATKPASKTKEVSVKDILDAVQ